MGECSLLEFLVTANVVPSSPVLVILMMQAIRSSETSALQEPHSITFHKTAFFKLRLCRLNLGPYAKKIFSSCYAANRDLKQCVGIVCSLGRRTSGEERQLTNIRRTVIIFNGRSL
jgi:hypothetical protein